MNLLLNASLNSTLHELATTLTKKKQLLCTAESCTGGWIAACCTSQAGSSAWFERGFTTYSNEAKQESLGVPETLITTYGAVSQEVAHAMAQGALQHSHAHWSISVTGIAGPGGGSPQKPIGLVWFGFASRDQLDCTEDFQLRTVCKQFPGDRQAVRFAAVQFAIEEITKLIK